MDESLLPFVFKIWPVALEGEVQYAEGRLGSSIVYIYIEFYLTLFLLIDVILCLRFLMLCHKTLIAFFFFFFFFFPFFLGFYIPVFMFIYSFIYFILCIYFILFIYFSILFIPRSFPLYRGPDSPDSLVRGTEQENLLEVVLGILNNLLMANEEARVAVATTCSGGKDGEKAKGGDTLVHKIIKLAVRVDVRPRIVDLALGVLKLIGKTMIAFKKRKRKKK